MEPAARAVNFLAHEFGQDQEAQSCQIHRERAPSNPFIIDETGGDEGEKAHHDPVSLLSPKFGRDRILAHVSGTINCDDAEDRQCQHHSEE